MNEPIKAVIRQDPQLAIVCVRAAKLCARFRSEVASQSVNVRDRLAHKPDLDEKSMPEISCSADCKH